MSKKNNKVAARTLVSLDAVINDVVAELALEESPESPLNMMTMTKTEARRWLRKADKFHKKTAADLIKQRARTDKLLNKLDDKIKAAAKELAA